MASLMACQAPPSAEQRRLPVISGQPDPGDPAVLAIHLRQTRCGAPPGDPWCTGSLIAPRVVLTAAHCLVDLPPRLLEVTQGAALSSPERQTFQVVETLVHPDFDPTTLRADFGLIRLDRSVDASPLPAATASLDASAVGARVRVVGFGETRDDHQPLGTKVSGWGVITAVDATSVTYGPDPSMTCHGDSGGPVLLSRDGTEVLVAVTSQGDPECTRYALNGQVAPVWGSFVRPFLQAAAPSPTAGTIPLDGLCEASCASDEDCPEWLSCETMLSPPRCVLPGTAPGDLTTACQDDSGCGEGAMCVRVSSAAAPACRCLASCDSGPVLPTPSPKPQGCGCCESAPDALGGLWMGILLLFLGLGRQRKRAGSTKGR